MEKKEQKQSELRKKVASQRDNSELSECRFKPDIIGYKYDISGLNLATMQEQHLAYQNQEKVEDRCLSWNR